MFVSLFSVNRLKVSVISSLIKVVPTMIGGLWQPRAAGVWCYLGDFKVLWVIVVALGVGVLVLYLVFGIVGGAEGLFLVYAPIGL